MRGGHNLITMANVHKYLDQKTIPDPNSGCVLWTGPGDKNGYGRFMSEYKHVYAHRMAYEVRHGKIPRGMVVRHKCDTPACCNVDHLVLGTPKDNSFDRDVRGRNFLSQRTHCIYGHEFTDENTIPTRTKGKNSVWRKCRTCRDARNAIRYKGS